MSIWKANGIMNSEKCFYCAKLLQEQTDNFQEQKSYQSNYKEVTYKCCCDHCLESSQKYLTDNENKKIYLYGIIFLSSVIMLFIAVQGAKNMIPVYICEIICGIAFILFPYPVINFVTLKNQGIKKVKTVSLITGLIFATIGLLALIDMN